MPEIASDGIQVSDVTDDSMRTRGAYRRPPRVGSCRLSLGVRRRRAGPYDPRVRTRPELLERLPPQYFTILLRRVREVAAAAGEPLIDLASGNPELGPPSHVVERLAEVAHDPSPTV